MDKFPVIIRLERNSVSILWNWDPQFFSVWRHVSRCHGKAIVKPQGWILMPCLISLGNYSFLDHLAFLWAPTSLPAREL